MPTITVSLIHASMSRGADTYINSGAATTNYASTEPAKVGVDTSNFAGILIWDSLFDAGLPANVLVTAATLTLTIATAALGADDMGVHLIDTPSTVVNNQVTWNIRATGTNWGTAGGDVLTSPASVDFSMPTSTGAFQITGLAPLVNYARRSESGTFGIILRHSAASRFFTFETQDGVGTAASLSITYLDPDPLPVRVIPNRPAWKRNG